MGIWPRYIEPRLLQVTRIRLPIKNLASDLNGLRVLHFSDLHLGLQTCDRYLKKLSRRIKALSPDICVFTGDFLCYSQIQREETLRLFLGSIQPRLGAYAVLGNHDYASYVSLKDDGCPGVIEEGSPLILRGICRLFKKAKKKADAPVSMEVGVVAHHEALQRLLSETAFQLLDNETTQVHVGQGGLNLCGLGDLWAGGFSPQRAFRGYNGDLPGIILSHNPDTIPALLGYPGDVILCGHTHGGQVNIPYIRERLMDLKSSTYYRGFVNLGEKSAYISRGVGAVLPFRWGSIPELTVFTLEEQRK